MGRQVLLRQVCSVVAGSGNGGGNGGGGGNVSSGVRGYVFAQCVTTHSGGAFWKGTALTRRRASDYLIAQVATHGIAMLQTVEENPALLQPAAGGLFLLDDEYVSIARCQNDSSLVTEVGLVAVESQLPLLISASPAYRSRPLLTCRPPKSCFCQVPGVDQQCIAVCATLTEVLTPQPTDQRPQPTDQTPQAGRWKEPTENSDNEDGSAGVEIRPKKKTKRGR